jgi:hypothetical protein
MIQSLPSGSRHYVSNHLTTDNHLAVFVLYRKISIFESFPYRIFKEFVVATVFALIGKGVLPTTTARQVGT